MIQLGLTYLFYIISRFYSGHEDGLVSQTEIALGKTRDLLLKKNIVTPIKTALNIADDTKRRNAWHQKGGIKTIFIALSLSVSYTFSYRIAFVFVSLLTLQILIFNPIIATKYLKQGYFYLGKGKWDSKFEGNEKLYYFTCLAIFLVCLYFIIRSVL